MSLKHQINELIDKYGRYDTKRVRRISSATEEKRKQTIHSAFREMRELGMRFKDVKSLKNKHIVSLVRHWEEKGQSASTITNKLSVLRTFSYWIGKPTMIGNPVDYVKNPESVKRYHYAREDKTWSTKVDIAEKLQEVIKKDPTVGIQLQLQLAFGLRMEEAALLKPHHADKGNYLDVNRGTKGGRDRIVKIENPFQRYAIDEAKKHAELNGSTIPKKDTFNQWRNHYYYIVRSCGIRREDGITSHGLRHERLNQIYLEITGKEGPLRRDKEEKVDPELDKFARQEVAETAGHSRDQIASMYLGSNVK